MLDKSQEHYDQEYCGELLRGKFPRPGAKLRYIGGKSFWPKDITANAERELRLGEIYTLKKIALASSSTCITLEETGETGFSLSLFEKV